MKSFDERRRGETVIHRDGMVLCTECKQTVEYEQLQHLDFYSDIQFAQCKFCAKERGEYCAVTQERKPVGAPQARFHEIV